MLVFTEEQVKKAYDNSSEIMKKILLEEWVIENSTLIGRKYNLRMDKVGVLNKLISYVMLNLLPMSRISEYVKKEIGLDDITTESLVKDIDENIFKKIKQEVVDYKNEKSKEKSSIKSVFENKNVGGGKKEKAEVRDYNEILDENESKNQKNTKDSEGSSAKDPYRSFID